MRLSRFFSVAALAGTCSLSLILNSCCHAAYGRSVRTAIDVTPGHCCATGPRLDWRYGAGDIRIQTMNVSRCLMDRWYAQTGYDYGAGKPRIVITEVDNRTDQYVALDTMRDVLESVAATDGRFTVVVGDACDECELDNLMAKNVLSPKYNNSTRLSPGRATAPQFLAKVRLTKAVSSDRRFSYEEYRLAITLYDIETQEIVDTAWDVLHKKVCR